MGVRNVRQAGVKVQEISVDLADQFDHSMKTYMGLKKELAWAWKVVREICDCVFDSFVLHCIHDLQNLHTILFLFVCHLTVNFFVQNKMFLKVDSYLLS